MKAWTLNNLSVFHALISMHSWVLRHANNSYGKVTCIISFGRVPLSACILFFIIKLKPKMRGEKPIQFSFHLCKKSHIPLQPIPWSTNVWFWIEMMKMHWSILFNLHSAQSPKTLSWKGLLFIIWPLDYLYFFIIKLVGTTHIWSSGSVLPYLYFQP